MHRSKKSRAATHKHMTGRSTGAVGNNVSPVLADGSCCRRRLLVRLLSRHLGEHQGPFVVITCAGVAFATAVEGQHISAGHKRLRAGKRRGYKIHHWGAPNRCGGVTTTMVAWLAATVTMVR